MRTASSQRFGSPLPGATRSSPPRPPPQTGGDRVLFVYWGRRGALSWVAAELAGCLPGSPSGDILSYARDNELADRLAAHAPATQPFRTFRSGIGAITGLKRFRRDATRL